MARRGKGGFARDAAARVTRDAVEAQVLSTSKFDEFHMESQIIYKLGSMNFSTQNDIY